MNRNIHELEIGKWYWFKYLPCNGDWYRAKITRFTDMGFPWQDGGHGAGIVSGELYAVKEIDAPIDINKLSFKNFISFFHKNE